MADLTDSIIGVESGGNPYARNPKSSAAGLGQFIDSTWLSTIRKHRPDLAQGKSLGQLLQLKFDPAISREMTSAYASDNQNFLKSRGVDPTPGNTYLAHFAGPAGAAALHANPQASAETLLGRRAVEANSFLRGKSGADVINWAAGKVGGAQSMPAGSGYLRQALNAAGAIPGQQQPAIGGAPIAGGPVPLTVPNMRYSKLADALLASAAGAKPKGWGDLLNSAGDAMLGYTLAGKADKEQGAYKSSLAQALMGANDTDAMARTLMSSGDEDLVKQGVALKVAQNKPQSNSERFMTIPGVGVMDMNTKLVVPGTEPKKQEGLMSVAPGNTILDPNSRQPVYTAPAKPEEKKYQFTKYGIGDPETGEIKPYAGGEGTSPELTQEQAKLEQGLRKEYSSLSADNRAVQGSVGRMRDSAKLASGPGDIAMIFSYMKMLDPTSVVREGEYATAANASGVPERVISLYNKAMNGQFLTPTMRTEFVTAGEMLAKGKLEDFGKLRGQFENIAKSAGADPTRILLDEGSPTPPPPPAGGAGNAPAGAVEMLRKDPSPDALREFDEMFGPGASQRALGR